ncbi:MAG: chorismate synthase [Treponema sp.]|jgi:chorismate synthase|nr:chorismate synthase [Treponema sp.]
MSSVFGNKLKISIFGQSHSPAIGVCIDGLPAGFKIDFDELNLFMQRRAPGQSSHTTQRREADTPEFVSGLVDGVTCGAPLTAIIRNTDARSSDYEKLRDIPRPSHADYTAHVKYGAARDFRGGGQFSGRLTAPLCVAGGLCLQLLRRKNVHIAAHIAQIGNITDLAFDPVNVRADELRALEERDFPVLDANAGKRMRTLIEEAKKDGDSVGGIVECCAVNLPAGIGEPIFDGIENRLAAILFGIPAVKGVEFGNGFAAAALRGSENNDAFCMNGDRVETRTNHHGGILGGISSGMPILFRVAFKPTPSIAKTQNSVILSRLEDTELAIEGRHDPCIVPRAVPCVEAASAVALYDLMLEK